jgi:hypothetical protein
MLARWNDGRTLLMLSAPPCGAQTCCLARGAWPARLPAMLLAAAACAVALPGGSTAKALPYARRVGGWAASARSAANWGRSLAMPHPALLLHSKDPKRAFPPVQVMKGLNCDKQVYQHPPTWRMSTRIS